VGWNACAVVNIFNSGYCLLFVVVVVVVVVVVNVGDCLPFPSLQSRQNSCMSRWCILSRKWVAPLETKA
jgi:hypothetical protein